MAFFKPYYNEAWYREYEAQKFYLLSNPPKSYVNCESIIEELFSLIPKESTFKDPDLGNKLDELYSNDPLYKLIKQRHSGGSTEEHLEKINQLRLSLIEGKTKKNNAVTRNDLEPKKKSFWQKLFGNEKNG